MRNIYLISEKELRQASMIDDNVDSTFLTYSIMQAQETGLQEVIGSELYESILKQVEEHTFLNDDYKTLLDKYIQPYLVNETMAQIVIPIQYKIRNAGIVVGNDQHYQNMNMADVERVQESYKHKAVFNANRMIEFVLSHKESFTEIMCSERWVKLQDQMNKCPLFFPKK